MKQQIFTYQYWRAAGPKAQWLWPLIYALIKFAEASVCLLCAGQWCPGWAKEFSKWRTRRVLHSIRVRNISSPL